MRRALRIGAARTRKLYISFDNPPYSFFNTYYTEKPDRDDPHKSVTRSTVATKLSKTRPIWTKIGASETADRAESNRDGFEARFDV